MSSEMLRLSEAVCGLVSVVVCAGRAGGKWRIGGMPLAVGRDFIKAAKQTAV